MAGIWFAVGWPGGLRSALWQAWDRGNSLYMLHRSTRGKHHRFSFSCNTLNCRWVEENATMPRRRSTIHEWKRDPLPPHGSGDGALLMTAVFPTSHLEPADPPDGDPVHWIEPAPPRWAVRLEFILAHAPPPRGDAAAHSRRSRSPVLFHPLRNGLFLWAIASSFDCGPVALRLPRRPNAPGQPLADIHLAEHFANAAPQPIRMVLLGDNLQPPDVWELAGYETSRR